MRCKGYGRGEKQDITAQQRREELTRDDREWGETIANSIPDTKEKHEYESAREKR